MLPTLNYSLLHRGRLEHFSNSYRFKHCIVSSDIFTRHDPWPADQRGSNIADDVAIQVRHDHHIKLLWLGNKLHATIVNDHSVVFNIGIVLSNFTTASQKKAVTKLPVKSKITLASLLVLTSNLLDVAQLKHNLILHGIVKSKRKYACYYWSI